VDNPVGKPGREGKKGRRNARISFLHLF
jgi:hypothetical protein